MIEALASAGAIRIAWASVVVLAYLALIAWAFRPALRERRAAQARPDALCVVHASQTGFAEQLANHTAQALQLSGVTAQATALGRIDSDILGRMDRALFLVSTTGEGDAPDTALPFVRSQLDRALSLSQLRYGILALGDRSYHNFCGFGHRLDTWLKQQGAQPWFEVIEVDNGDAAALQRWQRELRGLGCASELPLWIPPSFERWRLVSRRELNPGSAGDPCFHIELVPENGAASWQSGDIAEIDPRNSTWADPLQPLPARAYSIASIPEDAALHLLVRQSRRSDGQPGLGSDWLTRTAAPGSSIALRIRSNPNFHLPADTVPMIFVANGTGIAGILSLLKARIAAGEVRNWVIFGERNAERDHFHGDSLDRWLQQGRIERVDAVFSRDGTQRRYVQHALAEQTGLVRSWIERGAAVYVCGSQQGMAPGVHAALCGILGEAQVTELLRAGRYRRDVY